MKKLSSVFERLAQLELGSEGYHKQKGPMKTVLELGKYMLQKHDWGIKTIDKTMQRERYCPLYRQDAGVIHRRLLTRSKFENKWQEEYNKNIHSVKFEKDPK